MPLPETPVERFATLPDPARAASVDDIVERLRLLKVWAGDPSAPRGRGTPSVVAALSSTTRRAARDLYTELTMPEAADIETCLAELTTPD